MTLKKDTFHPSFIIGAISYLLLFVGIGLKANTYRIGDYVILAGIGFGGIHWIWSLLDVWKDPQLKGTQSRVLWVSLVIILAPVGGMMYYLMKRKRVSI